MMPAPKSISPGRPASVGLDFQALRQQGLEILQRLAGSEWTDYNAHDPGVTILEQLCYALTELAYRAELPIEDLLCEAGTGCLDPRRTALFSAETVLTNAPVTENDYRRLLIDRVPGVGNAWLSVAGTAHHDEMDGLHAIELYIPDPEPDRGVDWRRIAARLARRVYVCHRGLCEDVVGVHVLTAAPARLHATISIDASATAEAILAGVLYQTACFLAPEVRRQPLAVRLAGTSPADAFSGPLLRSGFIDDDQLQPRVTQVALADLTGHLARLEGVTLVRDVELRTTVGDIGPRAASALTIPGRRVLRLDTSPIEGEFAVRLIRDGAACRPDPALTRRELQRLWSEHRRRYDVLAECRQLLALPCGTPADAATYHSIQHHFPDVYGINARGLPSDVSESRRAQARQLKGYLLVFEQILADGVARLASARDLFSAAPLRARRPASLEGSVPDVAPLLAPSYRAGLRDMARRGERTLERWNRALDLMLATYGESLGQPLLSARTPLSAARTGARAKRALLRRLPWIAGRRGCGVDYLAGSRRGRLVCVEVKSRIQLGMDPVPQPLADLLRSSDAAIIGTAPHADRVSMIQHARHIDASFEAVAHVPASVRRGSEPRPISEDLLLAAGDQAHYRIGTLPGDESITVVCRAPSQPTWQLAGRYLDREAALTDVSRLLETVDRIESRVRRLTIVEHTLLRFGRSSEPATGYSSSGERFTATALVALPAREASDTSIRTAVHDVLRANTPAHIVLDVLFLRLSDAVAFEALHREWLRALGGGAGRERVDVCRRMRAFLQAGRH